MRKPLLYLLVLCASALYSQNWNVFNKNYRYNYKFNYSGIITNVMFADSVYQSGTDTVYKMNRIGIECTGSCPTVTAALNPTVTYVVPNMPQFLQRYIRKYSSGVVMLRDTSNQVIIPTCSVTQTWLFDSILNLNATCVNATVQNVFGQSDSIKTIIIGGVDSLVLSKTFGILKFPQPYNQNKYYRLVGIENRNSYDQVSVYGEKVPNAWDFYNFFVGDVISDSKMHNYSGNPVQCNAFRRKYVITDKSATLSGYSYSVSVSSKTAQINGYYGCAIIYGMPNHPLNTYNDVFDYLSLSSPTAFCNYSYPGMLYSPAGQFPPPTLNNLVKLGKDNHGKQIKYMGNACGQTFNITLPNTNAFNTLSFTVGIFQANGPADESAWAIGETYGLFQDHHFIFESMYDYCLVSLTRGGSTYFGNQDPIGMNENQHDPTRFFLAPNPASDLVSLPEIENSSVKVYNATGQLVHSAHSENTLDVSQFPSGIYLVNIESTFLTLSRKLVVEH